MLKGCRKAVTKFISFNSRRESIFASFIADTIFTSFRPPGSKSANSELSGLLYFVCDGPELDNYSGAKGSRSAQHLSGITTYEQQRYKLL